MTSDPMLQLFLTELRGHVSALEGGIAGIGAVDLGDTDAVKAALQPLIAAAHGVRSGALLVKMDALVALSEALESVFTQASEGGKGDIEAFVGRTVAAVELLAQASDQPVEEVREWIDGKQGDFEAAVSTLSEMPAGAEDAQEPTTEVAAPTVEEVGARPELPAPAAPHIDSTMLGLFRSELEVDCQVLSDGLLAVEKGSATAETLEGLMRAAHSAKGAARVVGLDIIVDLTHRLEDVFVAAQNEKLVIDSDMTDAMLSTVDVLSTLGDVEPEATEQWIIERSDVIAQCIAAIDAILAGEPIPSISEEEAEKSVGEPQEAPAAPPKEPTEEVPRKLPDVTVQTSVHSKVARAAGKVIDRKPQTEGRERILRVTARNLDRLMGLAGESLVESRWLQPFIDSLLFLKRRNNEMALTIDSLRDSLRQCSVTEAVEHYMNELQHVSNDARQGLADRIAELEGFIRQHASLSDRLYREVIDSRMRPFSDGTTAFPRMIRDLARKLDKKVKLEITGESTPVDRDILEKLEAPLGHLLRNALDHGIESPEQRAAAGKSEEGCVTLAARHTAGMLAIRVADDGLGLDLEKLRAKVVAKGYVSEEMSMDLSEAELLEFLFLPGFSTREEVTDVSGRGVGLDVVQSMVQEVGGVLRSDTELGKGTTFTLQLPLTLSVIRALIAEVSGEPYAFPLARIEKVVLVDVGDIEVVEDRQYFRLEDQNIGLVPGYQVLAVDREKHSPDTFPVVIVADRSGNRYGLAVDSVLGERELVVQELDRRLGKVPDISSGAFMENGEPVLVIDVEDLVRSIDNILKGGRLRKLGRVAEEVKRSGIKKVLVVDDSITVREVECRLLRNAGYEVDTAVDGMDGWNAARMGNYDLIVTDIDMPRMNGIELVQKIKGDEKLNELPVIIVSYKDREQERVAGLEAGANFYLTKSSFHDETLLNAVIDLIGHSKRMR